MNATDIWNTQTFQITGWLKLNIKQTMKDQFMQLLLPLIKHSGIRQGILN
jgi:hypothetical protein